MPLHPAALGGAGSGVADPLGRTAPVLGGVVWLRLELW